MPLKGRKCDKKLKVTRKIPNPIFQMMFSRYRHRGENTPLLYKSLHHNDFSFVAVKMLNSRHFRIHWLSTNMKGEKSYKHFLYVTTIIVNILINYLSYSITLKRKSRGIVCLSAGKQRKVVETECAILYIQP